MLYKERIKYLCFISVTVSFSRRTVLHGVSQSVSPVQSFSPISPVIQSSPVIRSSQFYKCRYGGFYHNVNSHLRWCVLVFFRVGEDGEWDVSNGIQTQNNETNYQVTGLFPFTVYSFRVLAVNAMGRSRPSKESYYMVTLREGEWVPLLQWFNKSFIFISTWRSILSVVSYTFDIQDVSGVTVFTSLG